MSDNVPSNNNNEKKATESNTKRAGGSGKKLLVCVGGKVFGIRDVFTKDVDHD